MQNKKVWLITALAIVLVVIGSVGIYMYNQSKAKTVARPEVIVNTPTEAEAAKDEKPQQDLGLPPGVEEPYCDCLADKIRPDAEWLPTRYSKSMWSTRDVPTEDEIKAYWEKWKSFSINSNQITTSKEYLMDHLVADKEYYQPDYYITRFFRERVDIDTPVLLQSSYYDYKTYYDRLRFEYLGPEYYKGPIPGSRVEETFMERYALWEANNENAFSPEFLSKTGNQPLTKKPDAFDPETELLWDQLSPISQDLSGFSFDSAGYNMVILLDYKLDDKGHLKEFIMRPIGRREAFRVTIDKPIESFIRDRYWAGWDTVEKNTVAMIPANKENEQYLQDLIRYRQPVSIKLNDDFKRKTYLGGEMLSWKTHEEYIRLFDPADNKIVMEASIPKRGDPNHFVQVYYGGDFVFEFSDYAFTPLRVAQTEEYPEIAEEKLKEDPEGMREKIEAHLTDIWSRKDENGNVYTYQYSLRDKLTLLAPPFTGIKEYNGPINFPYANDPNWKKDPKQFSLRRGFSFTGL